MSDLVSRLRELATVDTEVLTRGLPEAEREQLLAAHREHLRGAMAESVAHLRDLQARLDEGSRVVDLAESWAERPSADRMALSRLLGDRAELHRAIADLEEAMGQLSASLEVSKPTAETR